MTDLPIKVVYTSMREVYCKVAGTTRKRDW